MKSRSIKLAVLAALALNVAIVNASAAKVMKITGEYVEFSQGEMQPVKELSIPVSLDANLPETHHIAIYPDKKFQVIEGIGGAFNENGGRALLALPAAEQKKLIDNLFGEDGAAFTFNRLPMAATDFSIDAYSFSEVAQDYDMENFSFEREEKYMIPFVKAAYAVNSDMLIHSSPWSPPAWMKYSGLMDQNDKHKDKATLRDEPKVYSAYAKYMVKFVQGYAKEGVKIDRICIQNEPDSYAPFPGCYMDVDQMTKFTAEYLKPAFKKSKLSTELWAGTFRTVGRADHLAIINDKTIKVFDGIGFQYAEGSSIKETCLLYPNLKLMHTEGNCRHGENSPEHAEVRLAEIAGYINSGTTNFCYWNLILDEESSSSWGWKQNSLVKIDRNSGKVIYNPDFNALCITSRTLRPGDVRIGSYSRMPIITVQDKAGNIKLLVQNETDKPKNIGIDMDGNSWKAILPAKALCAFTITK